MSKIRLGGSAAAMLAASVACSAVAVGLSEAAAQAAATQATASVPDFSGYWQRAGKLPSTYENPLSGPGPVIDRVDHMVDETAPWIGDETAPILKPHAAAVVKKRSDFLRAGGEDLPAYSLCWPSGVPQAINLRERVQFLQTPNEITVLYQRDHQVRRIALNGQHPASLKPTWYGHSVGHYEGNTLVIDTVGLNDKTNVDKFGTPHSEKLHVVERYTLSQDGREMVVDFTVEDPETFTTVWGARATYRRAPLAVPMDEIICAENNKNASTGEDYPIPVAAKADF
jgi:hypothetical protein